MTSVPDLCEAEKKDAWWLVDVDPTIEVQSITDNGVSKLQTRRRYTLIRSRKMWIVTGFEPLTNEDRTFGQIDVCLSPENELAIVWGINATPMSWVCTKDRFQMVDTALGEVEQTQVFEMLSDWEDVAGNDYPEQT